MNTKKKMNSNTLLLLITIGLFIAMYAIGCIIYADKGFTHLQTFCNLLINNAALICVACGMTCVMLTGGIDISVGSLVGLDCMILAYGMTRLGWNAIVSVIVVIIFGVVFGLVQGFFIGVMKIQPFIVTMAGLFFARGMIAVITTDMLDLSQNAMFKAWSNFKIKIPFGGYMNNKGVYQVPYLRISVIIALLVVVAVFIILKYTKFGRALYAVGGNEQSARLMGLNANATKVKAYLMSSVLCSIGGICYGLNTMQASCKQAEGFEMDAIASAVIGGTLLTGGVGNVIGSFFGVLITGTIKTLVNTNGKLLSAWSSIMISALLCFFIILQALFAFVKSRKSR